MRPGNRSLIYTLFLLSGCTGLIYEVVWSRELIFVLGGTTYAITTVLVAFMSGLGIGSYLAGRISEHLRQPGRAYGYLEIVIGLYALTVPLLLKTAEPLYRAMYPHVVETPGLLTTVRFLVSGMILLFPTICMGATLPLLVRYITREGQAFGRSVSYLYGINTFGAMLGTMTAGFWLIPTFGLTKTTIVAAMANLLIGITAVYAFRSTLEHGAEPAQPKQKKHKHSKSHKKKDREKREKTDTTAPLVVTGSLRLALLVAFGLSGFAAMVYQISWTRALVMCVGSSTYAFTCILAAFIFGLAIGSLAIARWVDHLRRPVTIVGILQLAIALSAILIVPLHSYVPHLVKYLVTTYHAHYGMMMTYQFIMIIAITVIPTFLMGAIFPLVTRIIASKDGATGAAVGRAYAINTIGTVTGSFLAGFVMIRGEVLGVQNSIITAALLNAVVGAWLVLHSRPTDASLIRRAAAVITVVLAVPLIAVAAGKWNRELITSGPYIYIGDSKQSREVIYYGEGVDLTVSVTRYDGEEHNISMQVNGKIDASVGGGSVDMPTQLLLGHLPALLADDGKEACIIGLGSGISVGALSRHQSYEQIDCIEISQEVIKAAEYFCPYTYNVLHDDPRIHMIYGDGRNHLLLTDRMYDLILSQPTNPWIAGVANLFTKEFFQLCKSRLNNHGRLCVWLQGYATSPDDFKMVVRTFTEVFPFVTLWQTTWNDYLMIAGHTPFALPLADVMRRFDQPTVRADLCRAGLNHLGQVIGTFVTAGQKLRDCATSAIINTDDNAALEFSAPRNLFTAKQADITKLLNKQLSSPFEEVLIVDDQDPAQRDVQERATAVTQARLDHLACMEYLKENNYEKHLDALWKAYSNNPKDVGIREQMMRTGESLKNNKIQVNPAKLSDPSILTKIFDLPPLIAPPVTGVDLDNYGLTIQSFAIFNLAQNKLDRARSFLKEAQDIDPANARILKSLVDVLEQGGGMAQVIQQLDQLLTLEPDNGRLNYLRAGCAVLTKDLQGALNWLEKALKFNGVTPKQLKETPFMQPLSKNERFHALLEQFGN